ncbi:Sec-independent protein translocase subunit TatA/TatB [Candidatus Magnetomonas plexicatena]|uniref:Sec-independent protein translocase subunit TatA/TatB n=1 Tax=Candidatus Magnetomonas plexicatena TaxID=2552947 RepID=UPI001C78B042|nr:hypothetical protein E2O03_011870 [Nitrospirales bacterium LBB_01]
MFDLGIQEILVIFIVSLLLFGPKSMPEVAKNIGKVIGYFRKTYDELKSQINDELRDDTAPFKEEFDKINKDFLNSVNEFHAEHKPFVHSSEVDSVKKPEDAATSSQSDTPKTEEPKPADTTAKAHEGKEALTETKTAHN